MVAAAKRKATYEDLYGIPEDDVGEIINGELIVTPLPSRMHGFSAYVDSGVRSWIVNFKDISQQIYTSRP